jgi:ABC-type bacteriocin/lantibiotic exporter with double-glycine peptidase domain
VKFLSSANIETLLLLLVSQSIESFVDLRVRLSEKSFVLKCIRELHRVVYQRLLGSDWYRLKLADHEEMRRKINEACSSIQSLLETLIEQSTVIYGLINAMLTIILLCSWKTTISLIGIYFLFFIVYVRKRSKELFELRVKNNEMYDELQVKYNRVIGRMIDYVLHRERDILIEQSSSIQVLIESLYYISQYVADKLSFIEEILGKICTLIIISILLTSVNNPFIVIPIYHYLSSLINQIDNLINICISCTRLIKDYDLLKPMLIEYQPRLETKQYSMNYSLHIEHLHFVYKQTKVKRKQFVLQLEQPITFQMGESILITGNSGAGKSTFYDIISGCISKDEYTANVHIDNQINLPDAFHNLESLRTLVLQDTQMDFKCSIFTMITDIEDDDNNQQLKNSEEDEKRVWRFLRLVEIDNFVQENLEGQIHVPVENRLSGGQKTRLMLARALNRAEQRQSQILILDEPDRGLPSETTFRIMLNIVQWFRTKGILLLTLHNDRVRERLPLDHILHIEHGHMRSIPTNTPKIDSAG